MEEIVKIKVSQLPLATTLDNLEILGVDKISNKSVRAAMQLLRGLDGKQVTLRATSTHIQWRLGDGAWSNLISLSEITGPQGKPFVYSDFTQAQLEALKVKGDKGNTIELSVSATHIRWREVGTTSWVNLIDLDALKVKGDKGNSIELQATSTHIQWREAGTTKWNNLVELSSLKGATGASIEMQTNATHIQWRVEGAATWINLIALESLRGRQGFAPVLEIGEITTVENEDDATATLVANGVDAEGKPKFTLNLWLPKGKDGDGAGDMLAEVYDPNGKKADAFNYNNMANKPTKLSEFNNDSAFIDKSYVDNKVKTDVPAGAKFTDTTYNNATISVSGLMSSSDKSKLDGVEAGANKYIHPAGTNPHGTTKSDVGLSNVDNVKQIPMSQKGSNSGVAELDAAGKVPANQLPSFVDDVLEFASLQNFPGPGESGKIYIAINQNLAYRWSGTGYVEISQGMALGETSTTAYRGDRGKIAYDHSQSAHAPSNAQKNSDITKGEIEAKLTGYVNTHTHNLYFENITVTNWIADSTYADYEYRAEINCSGVTAQMFADVVFSPDSVSLGLAPICKTDTNKVTIYAQSDEEVTILTIKTS